MDRSKPSQGRGGKSKTPQFPSDIFALGAKTARNEPGDPKRTGPVPLGSKHPAPGPSSKLGSLTDRKRDLTRIEPTTGSSILPIKKSKISSPTIGDYWDSMAIDIEPIDLVPSVIDASNHDHSDKVLGLLCGALKLLKVQRPRPDSVLWMSLMYLAASYPYLFIHDCITQGLCSLLRKDAYKTKSASSSVLAANILFEAYKDTKKWPDIFVKLYLDDASNERIWVDHELCHAFVDNILTCVNTKPLPNDQCAENIVDATSSVIKKTTTYINVINRYIYNQEHVETLVMETIKELLNKRQALDNVTKNVLRLLIATCGISEIRLLVIPKLDVWLQNAKLMKPAQDLLMSVCINTTTHTQRDIEVISGLVKIRFKPKVLGGFYVSCIKELIGAHEENLATVLKHTIYNELSASRNPNNIQVLSVMFVSAPEKTAQVLADNVIELLLNRDDFHRPLRLFLREISRAAKSDLDLNLLAKGLMIRAELPRDFDLRDRMFTALVDLICLCCFLSVASFVRGDAKVPEKTLRSVAQIQSDAVAWLHDHAQRIFRLPADKQHEHVAALYKVTYMEPNLETYFKMDTWPPDTEKTKFMQLVTEVPLLQSTLCRILMIGLSKEHSLSPIDTMELLDQLIRRVAVLTPQDSLPMLQADNLQIIDLLFNLSTYHHPENIELPPGFVPPRLAITNMYWKSWLILLIYCAHNPLSIGTYCWEKFPTLKCLIEMTITNNFSVNHISEDLQMLSMERQAIIEFEAHLAAATSKVPITEVTSLLLSQLISLDPIGPIRRPPQIVTEQLKSEVPKLHLRRLLYRSRNPDFLLDIIKRQEPSQSMSWLADLVHSSEGSLNHLPVQCLCGFLLSSSSKQDGGKYDQLLRHLQSLLHEPQHSPSIVNDILSYFFHRLSFPENKSQAISGLKLLLNQEHRIMSSDDDEDDDDDVKMKPVASTEQESDWLLVQLHKIPHFAHTRTKIMLALRQACLVENDPHLIVTYLVFLSKFGIDGAEISEITELVQDMATLVVERSTIMIALVQFQSDKTYREKNIALDSMLNIFYTYFNKVRRPEREAFVWSESQDHILVEWPSGEQCTCNILVVHATVVLLSHEPQSLVEQYHKLLDMWFPLDHNLTPTAFLVDTSEEALLIPDWLKLRMVRSKVPRLVDAALEDLEPTQLLLFIQSFGIPIASMSKLLETMDRSVAQDKSTVELAVMDKAYMVQLVEVQHQRGATGGQLFASIIGEHHHSSPPRRDNSLSPPPALTSTSSDVDMTLESENLASVTPSQIVQLFTWPDMHLSLLKRLCEELSLTKVKNESTPFVKQLLLELMTHSMSKQKCQVLVEGMLNHLSNSIMVLRMLTACSVRDVVASLSITVKNIKDYLHKAHRGVTPPLLDIIDDFLKRNKQVLNKKRKGTIVPKEGELINWLVQIEPEPIRLTWTTSREAAIIRLFSREELTHFTYTLTLLIHHASWTTLYQVVQMILSPVNQELCNPKIVLDFLQALNFNPKFWQGRERTVPKHKENQCEDVLNLTQDQVLSVINYILREADTYGPDRIRSRISLVHSVGDKLIQYLISNQNKIRSSQTHRYLYMEFYLKFPACLSCIGDVATSHEMVQYMNNTGTTVLDKMSHTIITALTCIDSPRTKSHQLDNALRKLSSKHPILVLRQLPLLANSLLGIVYLESNVLRNRNYIPLFTRILNLVQLLQPHIFHKVYKNSLHSIINTYVQLFVQHGYMKEISVMLPKFICFIQYYVSNDTEAANSFIQENLDNLHCIQSQHPMIGILINGVHDSQSGGYSPCDTPNIPHDLIIEQLTGPDPSQPLQELERYSAYPAVLERLFPSLVALLTHDSSFVRSTALSLVITYVRHNPSSVSHLIPTLLNTLTPSSSPEVITTLCEGLPDLIVFAQEDALPLLSKLFSLNIWMNCNTLPSITRCISTLSLQSGC